VSNSLDSFSSHLLVCVADSAALVYSMLIFISFSLKCKRNKFLYKYISHKLFVYSYTLVQVEMFYLWAIKVIKWLLFRIMWLIYTN